MPETGSRNAPMTPLHSLRHRKTHRGEKAKGCWCQRRHPLVNKTWVRGTGAEAECLWVIPMQTTMTFVLYINYTEKTSSQLSLMWLLPSWANEVVQVLAAAAAPTYQITSRAQAPFLLLHPTFKVSFQLPKQTDSIIYTIKCTPKHTLEQQELRWNISY